MALARDDNESAPGAEDLEDGEIEDDGDEEATIAVEAPKEAAGAGPTKVERPRHERPERRRHDEKKKHMTEAEKSILHLRKRERAQREKWEKFRKEQTTEAPVVDDFAINIEKAIASVLKKDKHSNSDEEKEEEKPRNSRKRKNRENRIKNAKLRKIDGSPKSDELDDTSEPSSKPEDTRLSGSEDSYDSEYSSDRSKSDERRKRDFKKPPGTKQRNQRKRKKSRERDRRSEPAKDTQGVCVFFLQGKCQKNDCPYSHEAVPPMKLELCKFYLMECCAKGEKCSYMHSEFPCKFYHTGLPCLQGDQCKFAHGKALTEGLKQILFKHIETAPREILGGFPRMSREEALNLINITQQQLVTKFGAVPPSLDTKGAIVFGMNVPPPSELDESKCKDKPIRNRPSRWQDPDPPSGLKPFGAYRDQDMRITSNGDIDMRTLPPTLTQLPPPGDTPELEPPNFTQDIDIRNPNMLQFIDSKDTDIRGVVPPQDTDIRQLPVFEPPPTIPEDEEEDEEEAPLQIDTGEEEAAPFPPNLPKTQRDLFMRIQAQQKINLPNENEESFDMDENINWYSDDDDEDRLMIKVDNEEERKDEIMSPTSVKPADFVEQLGDLSKIDISAEVTKLLTSISQTVPQPAQSPTRRDPRRGGAIAPPIVSTNEKLSIYEQGSIPSSDTNQSPQSPEQEGEVSRTRPDIDLRNLHLPFKGMMNYTPAKEIDASINSHAPMVWKAVIVEIPRPDYTGLKLNVQDAEKTGDPRLRKIFRLSTEEKDSPASPKASPKAAGVVRIDPRLKKQEEPKTSDSMNYNQQLNMLQSSAFFQSLTSNQKLLLNQEFAQRNDQNGSHDPVLNSVLTNLNLVPNTNLSNPNMATAMNILANVNKLNPGPIMIQPGLLGAAPGIPNMGPSEFFDPRNNGGLLGNGPPPQFNSFQDNFGNYDEYYPQQDNFHNRDNRNFNRDRRRGGRNNFNRNNGNRNFRNNRNNRSNRSHTPP